MARRTTVIITVVILSVVAGFIFLYATPIGAFAVMAPDLHVTLIGVAVAVAAVLGVLALRAHLGSGDARSLAIGSALLVFAGVYVWHGVFTHSDPPFQFLIYGPLSRVGFGLALLGLASSRRFPAKERVRNVAAIATISLLLTGAGFLLSEPIAIFALAANVAELTTIRIGVEAAATILVAVAVVRVVRDSTAGEAHVFLVVGVLLTLVQSTFFIPSSVWSVMWWAAHMVGAAGMLTLVWGTLVVLQEDEHGRELDRARTLERERSAFINMAAHELRTPLTPVMVQLHLLAQNAEKLDDRSRRALRSIERNVRRLNLLVDDILIAARDPEYVGPRPTRSTRVDDLVDAALSALNDPEGPSKVERSVEPGLTVAIDPAAGTRVISTLFARAVASCDQGARVKLAAHADDDTVLIRLEDPAAIYTPQELARMFLPFGEFREPGQPGTGLDLYVIRRIIEEHGGRIWAENDENGTAYCVELPRPGPAAG